MSRAKPKRYGDISFLVHPTWSDRSVLSFFDDSASAQAGFRHSFNVTRETLPAGQTFAGFCRRQVDELRKALYGFEVLAEREVPHEAGDCLRVDTRWQHPPGRYLRQIHFTMRRGDRIAVMTATATDKTVADYEPVFLKVAESFRFV